MLRLEDGYSAGSTTGFTDDTADTAGASGGYFFSSWGSGDRLILRDLYRRYACPKVHLMKKIQQSRKGRSCGHWPMWLAMARALFSRVRKKISPTELENFFWDVISEGSQVNATLDRLLNYSSSAARKAVVPRRNVRRSTVLTSSDDSDEEKLSTALCLLPPRRTGNGELPLDQSPRRPPHVDVKEELRSFDDHDVVAVYDPTTVDGGNGAANCAPTSAARFDNKVSAMLELCLAQQVQRVSISDDCQPHASAAQHAFAVPVACPEYAGLVKEEPMFRDGSTGTAYTAEVGRGFIGVQSPERGGPDPRRTMELVDKGVQCELYWTVLREMMQNEVVLRMDALRMQRDACGKKAEGPTGQ